MIRLVTVAAVAIVAAGWTAAPRTIGCGAADWPQFRQSPCGARWVDDASAPSPDTVAKTSLLWTARLSAPVGNPVVSDGRIFVVSGRKHARLHALDAVTGRRQWQAIAGLGELYSPLVDGGVLLRLSNLDTLRRYDPATGRVFWRRDPLWSEGFLAAPLVADGSIYEQSEDLNATDVSTGASRWNVASTCFRCTPAVAGTRVYVAGERGLRALDAANGRTIWSAKTFAGAGVRTSPIVEGDEVLVVTSHTSGPTWSFYAEAFATPDGRARWHVKLAESRGFDPDQLPAAGGGLFFVPATDGDLYAVDESSGAVRWHATIGDTNSSPAVANGVVWIVDGANRLHAFSARDGSSLWTSPAMEIGRDTITPSPAIDGAFVLVGTPAGNLRAYGVR